MVIATPNRQMGSSVPISNQSTPVSRLTRLVPSVGERGRSYHRDRAEVTHAAEQLASHQDSRTPRVEPAANGECGVSARHSGLQCVRHAPAHSATASVIASASTAWCEQTCSSAYG